MIRSFRACVAVGSCVLGVFCSGELGAAAPFELGTDGKYEVDFPDPRVYDLTGTYHETVDPIELDYSLNQDADGNLTGAGEAEAFYQGFQFSITFRIKGKVKGSGGVTRIAFKMDGDGIATDGIEEVPFRFRASVKAQVTAAAPSTMLGTISVRVCVQGGGCASEKVAFEETIADDGEWSIELSLAEGGKGLVGEATVLTNGSDGVSPRTFTYEVTGKVNKQGIAKLKLKPVGAGKPFTLQVRVALQEEGPPVPAELLVMKGKLLGSKVKA